MMPSRALPFSLPRAAVLSAAVLALSACSGERPGTVSENWQPAFPDQYDSWASSIETDQKIDLLAKRPAMVVLWAGYPFARDYKSARGHQFAVTDVTNTLRTGGPMGVEGEHDLPASCWSCKTPDAPRLMEEYGELGFAAKKFSEVGHEITSGSIGCSDCHEDGKADLRLSRPHAQHAMEKIKQPFEQQSASLQAAQTCGQCHVEYYFQPEQENRVNIPWIFGNTADEIERYYDTRRFHDWVHPLSGAPMLKAQHPEYETWGRSVHAEHDVTCVSCHMPSKQNAQGQHYTEHNVTGAMDNYELACAQCHDSEAELRQSLASSKAAIDEARTKLEATLVKAHIEARAAWDSGAKWHQMESPLMDIRHGQWRWDFAIASHGIHAHNPEEALTLLAVGQRQANMARAKLAAVLEELGAEQVRYPELADKASAQAFVGLDMAALEAEKQRFLEQVTQHWSDATRR
ncbi:ammonia-forming cytochrome c nitrite reductase subunit c552 [Ferrimonas marina]|uniref:nitrite reductase (cytochrome; ammonia-forming) n=1 Tax=Ferrimonas marina TaxID=299255 RepID=A0A1M5R509_9GAMM|nr:ammonia-forming cytochrome c nitrite reductase subunit c552 [Ferrimonas marina]SHH20883.1 nitrite reductase (cytochrome c-552) [Ferrimonas marina]